MSLAFFSTGGQSKEIPLFGADQQIQAVRFMFGSTTVELKSSHGADGSTSLDVLLRQTQAPATHPPTLITPLASGLAAVNTSPPLTHMSNIGEDPDLSLLQEKNRRSEMEEPVADDQSKGNRDWTAKREWIMVVATLFASMTFQAGISPPGGYWQDDSDSASYPALANFTSSSNMTALPNTSFAIINISPSLSFVVLNSSSLSNINSMMTAFGSPKNDTGHSAGNVVWNDKRLLQYDWFYFANSAAFYYSLSVIFAMILMPIDSLVGLKKVTVLNILLIWVSYAIGSTTSVGTLVLTLSYPVAAFGALMWQYFSLSRIVLWHFLKKKWQTRYSSTENPVPSYPQTN